MKELDWEYIDALMPRRAAESSKNDYGRILCVCGSAGYTGAAFFAAQGAVRMGSGVVTLPAPGWQSTLEQRGFAGCARHFITCVQNQTVPETSGEQAILAQRIVERLWREAMSE